MTSFTLLLETLAILFNVPRRAEGRQNAQGKISSTEKTSKMEAENI